MVTSKLSKHRKNWRRGTRLGKSYAAACEILVDLKYRANKIDYGIRDNDALWVDVKKDFMT